MKYFTYLCLTQQTLSIMNISNSTTAHQMRIILTRTVHKIDTITPFNSYVLDNLLNASEKLMDVLMIEKATVSSPTVKELISLDMEALKMNMNVINSAIGLKKFKFEYESEMVACGLNMN